MRVIYISTILFIMTGCSTYEVTGNTGVYVAFSGKVLPFYQTTIIKGNTTTDYRHLANISVMDEEGEVINKSKSDIKGKFLIKVKGVGRYTIRAEFTNDVFIEKQFEVVEEHKSIIVDLIVE